MSNIKSQQVRINKINEEIVKLQVNNAVVSDAFILEQVETDILYRSSLYTILTFCHLARKQ